MTSFVDCFVRYDPEANVAMLAFTDSPTSGGTAFEIFDRAGLTGLLRLSPDGEFNYLELLGAARAIPQFIPRLTPPQPEVQDYHRGAIAVPMSVADDQDAVRFDLAMVSDTDPEREVTVTARESSAVVATLRRADSGVLNSLTLFASGNLLRPLIGIQGSPAEK